MITVITHKHKDESQALINEESWQKLLVTAIRNPLELLKILNLADDNYKKKLHLTDNFKLFVPLSYVKKMQKGDWNDPLLKQVLPVVDEMFSSPDFLKDPVADLNAEISSGVLQKYQGRVLLITTGACAVHCRYCFRRHFPYVSSLSDKSHWQQTLSTIRTDKSLHEVILSGGDPLMLSDKRLQQMCTDLVGIPHIKTLRFHSRMPLFVPQRINRSFLSWTASLPIQKVMVIHANHANELDQSVDDALSGLKNSGFTLLNQSVLLKGVNDDLDALSDLSERLFSMQVLPYYLHQLDRVKGAMHFEVNRDDAVLLLKALRNRLPGYLVPKYVEEISGERSKQTIV